MKKPLYFLLPALALFLLATPVKATEPGIAVIELFTTQGCANCPPADRILEKLKHENDPDLIALSCHVTYFDRLDWKDNLSHKFCDERHSAYSRSLASKTTYVPYIAINGRFDSRGNKDDLVRSGIKLGKSMGTVSKLDLEVKDGMIMIKLPGSRLSAPAEVWLFAYSNENNIKVSDGQNLNETINYVHAITSMKKIMDWNGGLRSMAFPISDMPGDGYAVIAQYTGPGEVIAAGIIGE